MKEITAEMIFDGVTKASVYVMAVHQRDEKQKQLYAVQAKRCGNCALWMTRGCTPEKTSGKLMSSNAPACGLFDLSDIGGLAKKFTEELAVLNARVKALEGGT